MASRPLPDKVLKRALEAYQRYGTYAGAARSGELDTSSEMTVKRRVEQAYARGLGKPNLLLKGESTLYDGEGNVKLVWEKSVVDNTQQILRETAEALKKDLPRYSPVKPPEHTRDLLTLYPVGDHHIGMLAWDKEVGANYDLDISESLLAGAFNYLVEKSPDSEQALIAFLGDLLHYDGFESVTPQNKNPLDTDSRFAKMIRAAVRMVRYSIKRTLEKHKKVRVIVESGNHDPASTAWLSVFLEAVYEKEPRVSIDTSPSHYHYHKFGKILIGTHHGHGTKPDKLPLIMASDRREDWGKTRMSYWHTGHTHQKNVIDYPGCIFESHRILAPNDAWAHQKGYRSHSDMKAIVYHKEYGEVSRNTVNPRMLG